MNGGKKRSEGDGGERRKGKGKLPTVDIKRLQLHWPEAHSGLLIALPIPSTAGTYSVKTMQTADLNSQGVPWELRVLSAPLDLAHC